MHLVKYTDLLQEDLTGWKGYMMDRCCRLHHLRNHTASTDPPHVQETTCGKNKIQRYKIETLSFTLVC